MCTVCDGVTFADASPHNTSLGFDDDTFEFAILDLNLGGRSSLELIPGLIEANPDIRTLILTGYASIATAANAVRMCLGKVAFNFILPIAHQTDWLLARLIIARG